MYCTVTDYQNLYGEAELRQLTDRDRSGAVDATVFGEVEAGIQDVINDYLLAPGSRVDPSSLPYATVPARLVQVAAALIRHKLFGVARSEAVVEDYKEALRYLESVAAGKIVPGGTAAVAAAAPAWGETEITSAGGRVFGEDDSFL
jgi:phage gp36-like protein